MSNLLGKIILFALATIATGIYNNTVQAQTETGELLQQIEQYSKDDRHNSIEQVTNVTTEVEHAETSSAFPSVNQLRDVSPTDWSYDALRSLGDRYSCISGFPDGTYRGNQPITRNEFAAGLNSCFEQIEQLKQRVNLNKAIRTGSFKVIEQDGSVTSFNDYQLTPERAFANMNGRLIELERRNISLEENQFSTTTKLNGNATLGFTSVDND